MSDTQGDGALLILTIELLPAHHHANRSGIAGPVGPLRFGRINVRSGPPGETWQRAAASRSSARGSGRAHLDERECHGCAGTAVNQA